MVELVTEILDWSAEIEDALIRELQRIREIETFDPFAGLNITPVEPAAQPANHRLTELTTPTLAPLPDPISLEEARTEILTELHDYANKKGRSVLLVAAPAGIGKSFAGIEFVQERARMGERWYWAAQNHAMYEDLKAQPNFDESLWYHWQPMSGEIDEEPACLYPVAQENWTRKGYKARSLCWWLCGRKEQGQSEEDTYMHRCPFRCQGEKQAPITFIMHQHLFTGLDDGKADGVVIDEGFISLLAKERYIAGPQIKQGSVNLKIIEFADKLHELWQTIGTRKKKFLAGKELMVEIADLYPDAVTQLQAMADAEELKVANKNYRNPPVHDAGEVNSLQTIYMDDLAAALAPEFRAYQSGMDLWAERVWIDRDGLHFVTAAPVWDRLPKKRVVLDASGTASFIQAVFLRAVEEYRPNVARLGKIYQVAGRMNHKTGTLDKKRIQTDDKRKVYEIDASKTTKEFIEVAGEMIRQRGYKRPVVICNQAVEKFIREGLGLSEAQTMHFYSLRGRNDFKGCDGLFVYGTPTPPERAITNLVLALDPRKIEPIYKIDEAGNHVPIYVPVEREFRLSAEGLRVVKDTLGPEANGAARVVGYYPDPLLAAIQNQLREAELLQAVYRARLLTNPAEVWLFTSVPVQGIELDGVYDDPPIAPGKIGWKLWLKLRAWYDALPDGAEFGYSELAAALTVREDYLRRLDILTALQDFYGFQVERGRKIPANLNKSRPREVLTKRVV